MSMEKKMNRAQQKLTTREKLFDSAIILFNKQGIKQTKIIDIAQHANVSTGTFYVHFKSKEEIISSIYYEEFNRFMFTKIKSINQNELNLRTYLLKIGVLELKFAEKVGVEITTVAFESNLKTNMTIIGNHSKKRSFSHEIKKTIDRSTSLDSEYKTVVFKEFETIIRGIMMTWCFNNGKENIVDFGTALLNRYLINIK